MSTTENWRTQAACQDHDPELWFPYEGNNVRIARRLAAEALRICQGCPVRSMCLNAATEYGVWGGVTGLERRKGITPPVEDPLPPPPAVEPAPEAPAAKAPLDVAAITEQYQGDLSLRDIADLHGVSTTTVKRHLIQHGVALRQPPPPVVIDDEDVARRYLAGETLQVIATAYGTDRHRIAGRLEAAGIERRGRSIPTEYKLNAEVSTRYVAGDSLSVIARDLGVSSEAVRKRLVRIGVALRARGQHHARPA